jgi:hypothetical protein
MTISLKVISLPKNISEEDSTQHHAATTFCCEIRKERKN